MTKPTVSVEQMQQLVATELSTPSRVAHVLLLLVASTMTGIISTLWITESALPLRTQIAFAVMVIVGLSWTVFSAWVLTRRRVLLAGHRVIATRMAVGFTGVFVLGSLALASVSMQGPAYPLAALAVVMLAAAIGLHIAARRKFEILQERRRDLDRELSGPGDTAR